MRRWPAGLGIITIAGLVAWPFIAPPYLVVLGLLVLMQTTLAASWNLLSSYTGYLSFGHVAFFGVGAYTTAILVTRLDAHWLLASAAGGAAAVLLSLGVGLIALRLRGPYFAIATLGLAEALQIVAAAWEPVTRGGLGIYLPPVLDLTSVYLVLATLTLGVVALTYRVATSTFGLRLLAIREDEGALESLGVNVTRYKLAAFALSAFFPGMAGGVYAWYTSYVDPPSVFGLGITLRMIVMAMFGGAGTVLGPVIGGVTLTLLQETLWTQSASLHQALFGGLIILLAVFMPGGVLALARQRGWLPHTRAL